MNQPSVSRPGRALAATLFGAFLTLYLLTLTQVHTFDALSYVTSVERKPWTELFHPHHLAYGPVGAVMLALGQMLGYRGGAALPMQLLNAISGALGVALFFLTAFNITRRTDAAFAAALIPGAAYAFWYYAVEIEVYTVATLFLIICLRLLVQPAPWNMRRCLSLGLVQGGAILFHQTNVLLVVPIAISALADFTALPTAPSQQRGKSFLLRWATYALAVTLTVALPYLYAMLVISGFRTSGEMIAWLTEYVRTGWWGGPLTSDTLVNLGFGLADTLAQPGGGWIWLALGLIALGSLMRNERSTNIPHTPELHANAKLYARARHAAQSPLLLLVAWLITYGVFFTWWEPDNVEFWIASLPPAALLLALALARARHWRWQIWGTLAIAATMIWLNYGSIERRGDASTDLQRVVARELAARGTTADLLIIPDGLLELYLPYYEQRENFISLNQAIFDNNGSWAGACATIQQRIDIAQQAGAAVLIADEALQPPPHLLERHHLSQQWIDDCFSPYRAMLINLQFAAPLPAYWRLPNGNELAFAGGWTFRGYALGWQAIHVDASRVDNGWRFQPLTDPAIISPLLNLEADRIIAIEIRMAHTTRARDAQLFYAGIDGAISEAHSLRWELTDTQDPTTYTFDMRQAPGWTGTITRLRIDPVGIGDGGNIKIESIRLILQP